MCESTCLHMPSTLRGSWASILGVFLSYSPPSFLKQGLLLNLEFATSVVLNAWQAQVPFLHPHCSGVVDSRLHTWVLHGDRL